MSRPFLTGKNTVKTSQKTVKKQLTNFDHDTVVTCHNSSATVGGIYCHKLVYMYIVVGKLFF